MHRARQQTFSVKGKIGNIFGFAEQMVSAATTRLCFCSMKAVIGNM